jgi:hypothetical protein
MSGTVSRPANGVAGRGTSPASAWSEKGNANNE